jgi:hypothetical protein
LDRQGERLKTSEGIEVVRQLSRLGDAPMPDPELRKARRATAGRLCSITDSNSRLDHAGKRSRSQTLGELFTSMAEENRAANRRKYYGDVQSSQSTKSLLGKSDGEKGKKEMGGPVGREHLFYVPPRKSCESRKNGPSKTLVTSKSQSIILNRRSGESIAKNYAEIERQTKGGKTSEQSGMKESQPETSFLGVMPTEKDQDGIDVEIVFCPKNQKQPKLKLVLNGHSKESPSKTSNQKGLWSGKKEFAEKTPDKNFHSPANRLKHQKVQQTEVKTPQKNSIKANFQEKKGPSAGQNEGDMVKGNKEHVGRLIAARVKRMNDQQASKYNINLQPKSARQKPNPVIPRPCPPDERTDQCGDVNKVREASRDPIAEESSEQRGEVFRIILPKKIPQSKPDKVSQIDEVGA